MTKIGQNKKYLYIAIFITIIYYAMIIWKIPLMLSKDDSDMRAIVSGGYTGTISPYINYMNISISAIFSLLYSWCGSINWYGLFEIAVFIVFMIIVLYQVLKRNSVAKKIYGTAIFILLYTITLLPLMVEMNFTYVADVLGCGIIFLLVHGDQKLQGKHALVCSILIILCFIIRSQVFFSVIPFIAIALIKKIDHKNAKTIMLYALITSVVIFLLSMVNHFVYNSGKWENFKEFDEHRTWVYDYYGWPEFDQCEEIYTTYGVEKEFVGLLDTKCYVIDDIDVNNLIYHLGEVQKQNNSEISFKYKLATVVNNFQNYFFLDEYVLLNFIIIASYLLAEGLVYRSKHRKFDTIILLSVLITYVCLFGYLIFKGRVIVRGVVGIQLFSITFFCSYIFKMISDSVENENYRKPFRVVILLVLIYLSWHAKGELNSMIGNNETINKKTNSIISYCDSQNTGFFIVGNGYCVQSKENNFREVKHLSNRTSLSGFMATSPLLSELTEKYNIRLLEKALLDSADVFYVDCHDTISEKQKSLLLAYYKSRYKIKCEWKIVYEESDFSILKPIEEGQ